MASTTTREIPTIVLSNENMKPGTSTWIQACKEIRRAFEDCGCFVGVYDKFPSELHNEIYAVSDELFSLPKDTKMQKTSDKPYHDYFGNYPDFPLYESIPVENPTLGGTQNVTDLMWPAGNERFSKSVHSFGKLLVELEQLVRRLILESYGIEKYYDSQIESSEYLLRFFKYRIPEINETNAGIPPHTDKNMVSILHQNHVNGLQVKNKDGNWVDLELSPKSSFVFLAAEALVAWSNGRIRSCEHQVTMKANETRYSVGLFSFNKGNIVVPEELVDDLHPLQYKPFDVYEYLWFNKSAEGMKVNGSIKAFCGVEDPQLITKNTTADLQ